MMIPNKVRKIGDPCPKCKRGSLDEVWIRRIDKEAQALKIVQVWGCDECQYTEPIDNYRTK